MPARPPLRALDRATGAILAQRVIRADRFLSRLVGLLGRRSLQEGEALLLSPCRSIHTLGMRFAIDALFLDGEGRVQAVLEALAPWRIPAPVPAASMVLELPAGTLARVGTGVGARVSFESHRA